MLCSQSNTSKHPEHTECVCSPSRAQKHPPRCKSEWQHSPRSGVTFGFTAALLAVVVLSALSVNIILWASTSVPAYAQGDQVSNAPRAGKEPIAISCPGNPGDKTYDGTAPLCMDYSDNDPEVWLPLWRWQGMASIITDSQADTEFSVFGIFQAAGNLINSVTNALSLIPLLIASILWHVTAFLIKFVMEPQFFNDLLAYAFESTAELWGEFKDLMGLSGDKNDVGAMGVILLLSIFIAVRQLILPAPGKGTIPWFQVVTTLLRTFALLAIAFHLTAGSQAGQKARDFLQTNLIQTIQTGITPLLTGVNNLTQARGKEVLTTCDAYTATLENIYRYAAAKEDSRKFVGDAGVELAGKTNSKKTVKGVGITVNKEASIRTEVPILVSRLWERFYYQPVGLMQFGDNIAARRGTCFLFEWQSNKTGSDISAILNLTSQNGGETVGTKTVPTDAKVANSIFNTSIGALNVRPGRVYMLLAAACEMLPVNHVKDKTDSRNLTIETKDATGQPWLDPAFKGLQAVNRNKFRLDIGSTLKDAVAALLTDRNPIDNKGTSGDLSNTKLSSENCTQWIDATGSQGQTGLQRNDLLKAANVTAYAYNTLESIELAGDEIQEFKTRTARAKQVIERLQGYDAFLSLFYAVGALASSVIMLWVMSGLSLGVIVAHFVFAMIILFAPLLLIFMALPTRGASKLTRTILRLFFMSLLAYVVFFFILMILLLTVHILIGLVDFATRNVLWVNILATSLVPLLAMYVIQSITKMMGINANFASPIGMADFTSGLAASGMSIGDGIAYARGFATQTAGVAAGVAGAPGRVAGAPGRVAGAPMALLTGAEKLRKTFVAEAKANRKKHTEEHGSAGIYGLGAAQALFTLPRKAAAASWDRATAPFDLRTGDQKWADARSTAQEDFAEGIEAGFRQAGGLPSGGNSSSGENGSGRSGNSGNGSGGGNQKQPPQGTQGPIRRVEGSLHSVGSVITGAVRGFDNLRRDIVQTMERTGEGNVLAAGASVIGRNLSNEAKRNKEENVGHKIGMSNVPGLGALAAPITAAGQSIANNADDSAYYERLPEYQKALRQNPIYANSQNDLQDVRLEEHRLDDAEQQRQEALAEEKARGIVGRESRRENKRLKLEQEKTDFQAKQRKKRESFKREGHTEAEQASFDAQQAKELQVLQQQRRDAYGELRITSPEEREELRQREQGLLSTINSLELQARKAADEARR